MFSKQGHVLASVNNVQMNRLILFCVAVYCFQDIHANSHCDSMSNSGSVCVTITNPPRANISDNEVMNLKCTWETDTYNYKEWTFNGSTIPSGSNVYFNTAGTISTLVIRGSPQQHGEYRCVVVRKDRESSREFAPLFIYYFPKILFEEPINRNSPSTDTLEVGDMFSYTCTATNQDRKLWTDRFKNPILTTPDGRVTVTTGHTDTLTFNQVTHDDAKEYYCYAYVYTLNESSPVIQELHLFRPVVVNGPPTIHCYESSIAVAPGSLVSFVCRVQAYPGPVTISWDGSAERTNVSSVGIRNKYYTFISVVNAWNSTLSFKDFVEVNDSGMYTITARNSFGESSVTVELHVHHTPGAIMQPEVVALSATRVRVSWKEPEDKDMLGLLYYMVLYGVVGSQRQQVNVSADELQVELTLLPVTEYYFAVGAVNRRGTGELSHRETITTKVSVPVAPVSVTVDISTVTPESAVVTWSPLTGAYTGGYDIVRYIVSYKREDEEWSMAKTLDAKPDAWQATLTELEPNSTYSASVKGENVLGEGFPAESQMFTTPVLYAPGSPFNVTPLTPSSTDSSVQLYVCWTPGPNSYHIMIYQISVYQHQNGTQLELYKAVYVAADSVDTLQLQTCALVSGLQTDSCYWFSVAAQNEVGTSNASRTSDSSGCTVSGLSSGLEAILREPEVLAPIIIAAVVVAILLLLCGTACIVKKHSRKKGHGLYDVTNQGADGCNSLSSIQASNDATHSLQGNPNQAPNQSLNSKDKLPLPGPLPGAADLFTTSITPDSGIPSLPLWDEEQLGPAARYDPPQGSLVDNSNEAEKLIQWTIGPAHESRDTPPIVDRSVSVDHTDSGVDYGEDFSHFDSQVSNPGQGDSEMDFEYTDNVAYWTVASTRQAGASEQLRGIQKQPVGMTALDIKVTEQPMEVTAWNPGAAERSFGVTLRQDPNCREKEFVTFRQPSRGPPRSQASSNSLQTSL